VAGLRVLYGSGGPLLADASDAAVWTTLLEAARDHARESGAVFLRLSPKVPNDAAAVGGALVEHGFTRLSDDWTTWNSPRIVMTMDIREDEESLLRKIRKRYREYIVSAERRGIAVRAASSMEAEGRAFQVSLAAVGRRKGLPVRGREYFESLWKEYVRRGDGVLLLAEHEGEVVGGLFGVRFGARAYMLYISQSEGAGGQRLQQGPLLYWEFVRWARAAGCESIDWGGIGTRFPPREDDPGYGVYHFKLGFNSRLQYLSGYYDDVYRPAAYRLFRITEKYVLAGAWSARAQLNGRFRQLAALAEASRRKLRQFRISASQRGIGTTLYWAAFGFLRPNRFEVLVRDLGTADLPSAQPPGIRLEMWDAEQMRAWRRDRQGLPPDFFQDEIDGVHQCAVAVVDGEVAGLIWVYRPDDASRLFRLRELEAELNNGHVRDAFRGRGLFRELLMFACRALRDQGFAHVYAMVHADNGPSLQAFAGAGFRRVRSVWHFLLFRPKVDGIAMVSMANRADGASYPAVSS